MFLHSILVENYRAIQKGQLTLDKSIAVIGENDSGKSSLIDALRKMLDPIYVSSAFKPETRHFYHKKEQSTPEGPLKIELVFEETQPGEWKQLIYKPIHDLISTNFSGKQKLILQFRAGYDLNNQVFTEWLLINPGANMNSRNDDVIKWLRKTNPLIVLYAGMLTGHGSEKLSTQYKPVSQNAFPENLQKHVQNVQKCSEVLLSGSSIHIVTEIEEGYEAALKLNSYLTALPGFDGIRLSFDKNVVSDKPHQSQRKAPIAKSGSNSEKLGALLVMNALIQACRNTSLSEVDPIWVIEDPEAHLHKITLASVSNIIKGISGQKIITTNSGGLLATIPLHQVRRLIRNQGVISEYFVGKNALSKDDIRRVNYHVRAHRNSAFFSRVWLLVEGETEFWILPRLARILGYDFRLEGITCVEYAQSGLKPLLRIAEQLNIKWLMLSDGDRAGYKYAAQARNYVIDGHAVDQICVFPSRDIEQYFWDNGFDHVYIKQSRTRVPVDKLNPSRTIKSAIRNYSKPHLALSIVEAASCENATPVPKELIELIENCVLAARDAIK